MSKPAAETERPHAPRPRRRLAADAVLPATHRPAAYAIKVALPAGDGPLPDPLVLDRQKTMYGGRLIAPGDRVYLIDSAAAARTGRLARGVVASASDTPRIPTLARQTPRVDVAIARAVRAPRAPAPAELRRCSAWDDGRPETELNFKLYRQGTDKIVGLSAAAAAFLDTFVGRAADD